MKKALRVLIALSLTTALSVTLLALTAWAKPFHGAPIKIGDKAVSVIQAEDHDIDAYFSKTEKPEYGHTHLYDSDY